ncbi:MAG: GspE/PulE family protein [Planctomycetota bacterium]|jgi:type IV pilus assembly protein PilB
MAKKKESQKVAGKDAQYDFKTTDGALVDVAEQAPVPRLLDYVFEAAIGSRATDVHFDPHEDGLVIRYRIDGLLHDVLNVAPSTALAVVSRLKVLANMDIVERRHSQDGRLSVAVGDHGEHDMRVGTVPTTMGEKVAVRIMTTRATFNEMSELGLEPDQMEMVKGFIARPYGMILATGPVGSGKTTSLYSMLMNLNSRSDNVMTIEDPVEYRIIGTNQVQVNMRVDFTFAEGLRAMLRQDPDIIMVGEIRDNETAKIGVWAALTGVLVLSTLHANDAPSTITTLFNFDIPGFLVSNSLVGIISQRLIRKICAHCQEKYKPDADLLKQMGIDARKHKNLEFTRGMGCTECFHTGYSGRTGVFEVMDVNEDIKDLIFRQTTREVIRQVARDTGMKILKETAFQKVVDGVTSVEEYFRVVYV